MELILQKVCGRPAQLPIRLRRCGPADAAAFFALQNEVRAAMPHPEQFVPDTLENITAYLREDLCIGATVSPENQYSLNNALACGFVIADRREMYGGYDRYLLKKML